MRLFALLLGLLTLSAGSAFAGYAPDLRPYMQPVDAVMTAMAQHNAKALMNAYTDDAVIVDDQAPYRWSGRNAPAVWLSALTTFGKLHYARFTAFGYPMQIMHTPNTAYVTVIGKMQGLGVRSGLKQYATITFALRKIGSDWKITSQSWTDIPPPNA